MKVKNTLQDEMSKLAKYLSGELDLQKRREEAEKMKELAVQREKDLRRKKIIKKEIVLEKDDITEKKVVQKIKLFEWEAPIRFKMPLDMKTYMVTVGLSMVFVVYLAVLGKFGLMAALIALLFFIYVAGTTEPIKVKHQINTRGVETMDKQYEWYMLDEFWFTKKDDEYMLHIQTKLRFPARLLLIVDKKDISPIFVLLQDKLLYKDIKKESFTEKKSFGEYIKLEDV